MRSIGVAENALDRLLARAIDERKKPFGLTLSKHETIVEDIARSRMEIDQARMLVLAASHQVDLHHAKGARKEIGMAKVVVPSMACKIIDRAM